MKDQRQRATCTELEALLEAELRVHGCDNKIRVTAEGDLGDWTAKVHGDMAGDCTVAYAVLLNRLKRDRFLDYD